MCHCIPSLPILIHLKVQMIAGGPPGLAHITDHLPGFHLLTGHDADGGAMRIQSFQAIAVVNANIVAISTAPTVEGIGNGHRTPGCRQNWASLRRGDVGAAVVAGPAGDRVGAVTEL